MVAFKVAYNDGSSDYYWRLFYSLANRCYTENSRKMRTKETKYYTTPLITNNTKIYYDIM